MDHNLLISELQALVVESKRRNPEVKEAAENALEVLRAGPLSKDAIGQHADKLLAPITLGCKTKTGKIIGISIAALQRLVSLKGVPTASLPGVLATLTSVAGQAVDVQLKILQVLLSILTHNLDVHDDVLGSALLLCFKLQDTRVSVVSSTAAATLRQAVMLVFDRISSDTSTPSIPLQLATDPPTEITVSASGLDAFNLFSDLCILTAGTAPGFSLGLWGGAAEKPRLLKLSSLQRTFGLELIESVLSGYEDGVKKRHELVYLLAHSLDPLLQKLLHEKPTFPIALRVCRLEFLLIRSFSEQLPAQVEGYLTTLIRIGTGDATYIGPGHTEGADEKKDKEHAVPSWLRVLALEIFRGICGDGKLLQNIFTQFDTPSSSVPTEATTPNPKVFAKLVAALGRLLNEKPVLLGSCGQMNGIDVHSTLSNTSGDTPANGGGAAALTAGHGHGGYLDMGLGMMASAANVGITTVGSMIGGPGGGLGVHSGMKLRLIEQHDKAEAPLIPDTYIYLLALQSLNAVAEAIYLFSGASSTPSPTVVGMAESAWPALLAALSYGISTNLSDTLFADVLSALSDYTVACGLLSLTTPRDAFLNTLGKYAVPPPAVSAMQAYLDGPATPRNNSVVDSLGMGVGALTGLPLASVAGPPGLSERNMACLKSMVTTTRILAGSLDERAWHEILETLQNANYMLGAAGSAAAKKPGMGRRGTHALMSPQLGGSPGKRKPSETGTGVVGGSGTDAGVTGGDAAVQRPAVFDDLDAESVQSMIAVLFDGTRDLDDAAFRGFVAALCRLSEEMIGGADGLYGSQAASASASNQQFSNHSRTSRSIDHGSNVIDLTDPPSSPSPSALLSPAGDVKRRISALGLSNSIRSGDRLFSLQKLRLIASINLSRLVNRAPEVGWTPITTHLLAVARHATAPTTLRLQASDTTSELLLGAIRVGKESRTQHQVFDVLVRQVDVWPISNNVSTDYDVRSSGYQTLNSILESSGHELEVGWTTIFDMLNNVCKTDKDRQSESTPKPAGSTAMKRSDSSVSISSSRPSALSASKSANLVRIAFPSLTLICTDFLASLDQAAIRQCIACLGAFGRQKEDVNITLAAIGLLWNVSDKVQRDETDVAGRADASAQAKKDVVGATSAADADGSGVWLYLLKVMLDLARDGRLEVRSSAMQTLFRCVEIYGAGQAMRGVPTDGKNERAGGGLWESVWWDVISPLLDSADLESDNAAIASAGLQASTGDEATVLALTSTGGLFHSFLPQLAALSSFDRVWQRYLERIEYAWKNENRHCCNAALKSLERALSPIDAVADKTSFLLESTWTSIRRIADRLETHVYAQDNLVGLVKICKALHDQLDVDSVRSKEKDLSGILRAVMIYDKSPESRPDTDHMSPLQENLTSLVGKSDKLSWGVRIGDVAEWTSLAFVAGGKCTYVGLSKWGMRWMERVLSGSTPVGGTGKAGEHTGGVVDLEGEEGRKLFGDGTVESVLAAYALPIKMSNDCPPANRFGEDAPLWRTGMDAFVPVLRGITSGLDRLDLAATVTEPIYTQIIDIFASILLADTSSTTAEADEAFILPILTRINAALVPHLPQLTERLAEVYTETLRRSSVLYRFDVDHSGGTTAMAIPERSEDVRYWAFGELVAASGTESAGRDTSGGGAVARIAVQSMERRMRGALRGYVDDARLRGQMPLGRIREQELLYILRHLATLRLHPAPPAATSPPHPSTPLVTAIKASPRALLFSFYPLLLEIAFLPGHTPSMWMFPDEHARLYAPHRPDTHVSPTTGDKDDSKPGDGTKQDGMTATAPPDMASADEDHDDTLHEGVEVNGVDAGDGGDLIEVTARDLARRCLELVGEEMGLGV